tara:strand:- start:33692 stop:34213 length:522 start_codon:yes stop_codon:yes gene_type:complete
MKLNEGIIYNVENNVPLHKNPYRYGSVTFFQYFNDLRKLKLESVSDNLKYFLDSDIGKVGRYKGESVLLDFPILSEAEYQGKKVELNKPKRGGSKKFYVYVKNKKGNVIKVSFGAKGGGGKLSVKLKDPKARKAFSDRHDCPNKKDKTKAGYWSCALPRYAKSLGLSGGGRFW